jgi:ABC-type branched-subunit amino acid transport system substrate-binding protein
LSANGSSNGNESLSAPQGVGSPGAVGQPGSVPGATGAGGSVPGSVPGATGPGGSTGPVGSNSAALPVVGVTPTRIYVGVTYATGDDQANKALGNNITTGDERADAQAVIDDINAKGGVAGRKLTPVWYDYQETDARPYGTIDDEACARFTQDNHVFAVAGDGISDEFPACNLKKVAVIVASASGIIGPDKAYFAKFRYLFSVGYLTQDRMMAAEVPALLRQHYFTGWNTLTGSPANGTPAKLGILGFDTPSWTTPLTHVLLPALKAAGYSVSPNDIRMVAYPSGTNGVGTSVSQIQAAVLRFRQDQVTHVIDLDAQGSMTLYMLQNMRAQNYYPRLGINSASGAQQLSANYAHDAQSFNGAVGLGWSPIEDLPDGGADKLMGPGTTACINNIERRTGQKFSNANAAAVALGYCDELYLLADAINRAGPTVNRASVSAAIESMGGSFPAAGSHQLFFGPSRHDGVEDGYDLEFDESCTCAKYVRGPFAIP